MAISAFDLCNVSFLGVVRLIAYHGISTLSNALNNRHRIKKNKYINKNKKKKNISVYTISNAKLATSSIYASEELRNSSSSQPICVSHNDLDIFLS